MKVKDIIPLFIVFILLLGVIYYEYKVSVQQIPATGNPTEGRQASYQGVSSKELFELMKNEKDLKIIDVRNKSDFNDGHIPGAISIEFPQIDKEINNFDKNSLIILYCESGPWSRLAYDKFKEKGFKQMRMLVNGIVGWQWEINGETIPNN